MRTPTTPARGASSWSIPSRFASGAVVSRLMPVAFPPGRLRLATNPILTGSPPVVNTIGIEDVAAFAATTDGSPPVVTSTATRLRTSSAASAGRRSYWPSAQRYSTATFCPSMYPLACSPMRNASTRCLESLSDLLLRNPIKGIAGCCARAASGQVTTAATDKRR